MESSSAANDGTESPIRVTVTPSQSAYFAGEPFTVTITFKNIRTSQQPLKPKTRSASLTHKRASHSISSAPLPRPPTSPGTPRTLNHPPTKTSPTSQTQLSRRGLIGKDGGAQVLESRVRHKLLARSLSVTISPQELAELERGIPKSAPFDTSSFHESELPLIKHTIARSASLPLGPDHPHARKKSSLDGQPFQLQDIFSPSSSSSSVPQSPYPSSPSTSATASTFSLSLDPISEMNSPSLNASTAAFPQPTIEDAHHHPVDFSYPSRATSSSSPLRSPFTPIQSELILYSYAQLTGTVSLTPPSGTAYTADQFDAFDALRVSLTRQSVIGGGSMDISPSLSANGNLRLPGRRPAHGRTGSFGSGLLSLLTSSPSAGTNGSALSHRPRTPSASGFLITSQSLPSTLGQLNAEASSSSLLPTLEMQPTMLAVDLALQPGEERSYTYTAQLPDILPPTYKGRALQFSYELVVGTCRANQGPRTAGANGTSRVMKLPIRVYNHVEVGRIQGPYDLMWPVGRRKTGGKAFEGKAVECKKETPIATTSSLEADLKSYAAMLLASTNQNGTNEPNGLRTPRASDVEVKEEGMSCREAVEVITRIFKKVSYDVNKDGRKVAVLTFTKSAYRLGETIQGVVELNERTSQSRVLQLSVFLESQETLPSTLSTAPPPRNLRRIHAEHYSALVSSALRTTFALDIPPDASPAFQVALAGKGANKPGGLEWKVRLCLHVAVANDSADPGTEGVVFKALERDGERGEWGSSWKALSTFAPHERILARSNTSCPSTPQAQSWSSFFASTLLGAVSPGDAQGKAKDGEAEFDGIKPDLAGGVGKGVQFGGVEDPSWRPVRMETVECEVPVRVWPGNTAFKPLDVLFDV